LDKIESKKKKFSRLALLLEGYVEEILLNNREALDFENFDATT